MSADRKRLAKILRKLARNDPSAIADIEKYEARPPTEDEPATNKQGKNSKLNDMFMNTDIHGLPEWYSTPWSNLTEKLCWSAILLLAVLFLTFELYIVSKEYRDNPIKTEYSYHTMDESVRFPDVYICSTNFIHQTTKLTMHINQSWEEDNRVDEYLRAAVSTLNQSEGGTVMQSRHSMWDELKGQNNEYSSLEGAHIKTYMPQDIEDYFKKVGFAQDFLFEECSFATKTYSNCSQMITEILDRDYGKCFLIQPNRLHRHQRQASSGTAFGLSLLLNLKDTVLDPPKSYFNGIIVKIAEYHDPGSFKKLFVAPGFYTQVGLKAELFEVGQVSKDCVKSHEKQKMMILEGQYSQDFCFMDCIMEIVEKECQCILPIDRLYVRQYVKEKYRWNLFCSVDKLQTCATPHLMSPQAVEAIADCRTKRCKSSCSQWMYDTEVSILDFPGHGWKHWNPSTNIPSTKCKLCHEYQVPAFNVVCKQCNETDVEYWQCLNCTQGEPTNATGERVCYVPEGSFHNPTFAPNLVVTLPDGFKLLDIPLRNPKSISVRCDKHENFECTLPDFPETCPTCLKCKKPPDSMEKLDCRRCSQQETTALPSNITKSCVECLYYQSEKHKDFNPDLSCKVTQLECNNNEECMQCTSLQDDRPTNDTMRMNQCEPCHIYGFTTDFQKKKDEYMKLLQKVKGWEAEAVLLDIGFSSLQYAKIEQSPALTFSRFVSDIGGQVGLWLGASIITLVKLFMYCCPVCIGKIKNISHKRSSINVESRK